MTREEAIEILKENYCSMCAYGSQNMESCDIRECDNRDAIKALEQKPVLDKIREDINSLHNGCGLFNDGVDASLKLIDKYRTKERD